MDRKQKIIFDDLTKHFRERAINVVDDFIDRCDESDMPTRETQYIVVHTYMRIAIVIMQMNGFSPQQCAKFAIVCARAAEEIESEES